MSAPSRNPAAVVQPFPHDRRSDADLVRGIVASDEAALREMWRRYSTRVRRSLVSNLGSDEAIDDLVQESFIALVKSAHRIEAPEKVGAYLIQTALRQARQILRSRRRRRRWTNLFVQDHLDDKSEPDVQPREAIRRLHIILDSLPDRLRESFILRFVDGCSLDAIAETRDVSLATAKRDIARAQERVLLRASQDSALASYLNRVQEEREDDNE